MNLYGIDWCIVLTACQIYCLSCLIWIHIFFFLEIKWRAVVWKHVLEIFLCKFLDFSVILFGMHNCSIQIQSFFKIFNRILLISICSINTERSMNPWLYLIPYTIHIRMLISYVCKNILYIGFLMKWYHIYVFSLKLLAGVKFAIGVIHILNTPV